MKEVFVVYCYICLFIDVAVSFHHYSSFWPRHSACHFAVTKQLPHRYIKAKQLNDRLLYTSAGTLSTGTHTHADTHARTHAHTHTRSHKVSRGEKERESERERKIKREEGKREPCTTPADQLKHIRMHSLFHRSSQNVTRTAKSTCGKIMLPVTCNPNHFHTHLYRHLSLAAQGRPQTIESLSERKTGWVLGKSEGQEA